MLHPELVIGDFLQQSLAIKFRQDEITVGRLQDLACSIALHSLATDMGELAMVPQCQLMQACRDVYGPQKAPAMLAAIWKHMGTPGTPAPARARPPHSPPAP